MMTASTDIAAAPRFRPPPWLLLVLPVLVVEGALLLAPIASLLVSSFGTGDPDTPGLTWDNYAQALTTPIFHTVLLRSLWTAAWVSVLSIALSYPLALFVTLRVRHGKVAWLALLTIPSWTSYLLRIFAWKLILGYNGVLNSVLLRLHLVTHPIEALLYSNTAVIIALTHAWMPFALLPIYIALSRIDPSLLEAARDLGDGGLARLLRVILPLSLPGLQAAFVLVFIPVVGDYVTPLLVGGSGGQLIGNVVSDFYGEVDNPNLGAALAVTAMIATAVVVFLVLLAMRRLAARAA
jgi:spermidine/putrescine transport system permease protein